MFGKGEHVVCGSKGVCLVENITKLDISGADREREYYVLKPVYMSASTVYIPVDSAGDSMRRILGREEAQRLIDEITEIPPLAVGNDKLLEQEYRECMRTNQCRDLVRVLKTIYLRKQKRREAGRKVTALDAKYFRIAEDNLYGELAISLDIPRTEVERSVAERIEQAFVGQLLS